ncbi:right-handed parallel beta-helix repeat-containing protein [Hymenobacter sp. GOD-10R]|uniref:right-handed parallel beta-helix repeat-containing protein n=1 Tax=Hymenobacter sp. GOD-10R TaxID=3093922 RepID=UPI002D76A8A1|nr:right-handed parallel beta-helix repeat-containing protein [Hymenobacter sp. GOD-10R]WRQ29358.1 right-handed parallel beta-helix repeat-containing protein [Hymenobacter sp. GOD-10R]
MRTTLRFVVLLLAWTALGRTVAWAQCQPSFLDNSTSSNGLTAEYYRTTFYQEAGFNANAITFFQRTAQQRRIDQTVNFTTATFSIPATAFSSGTTANPDNFSARYRGSINIPVAGSYTFYLTSDDASYMWIDNPALATTPNAANASISNGGPHAASEKSFTVTLTAGFHDVLILYAEEGGENVIKLEYASTAAGIARQVIPASALCAGPASANNAPVASNLTNATVAISSASAVLSPNLSGTDADGTLAYYNILTLPAATAGVLRFNNTAVVAGQAILSSQLNLLTFTPVAGYTGSASFTYTVTDNTGRTAQTAATYTIPVASTISGVVFEDVNYGGGAGRPSTASGAVARPNATVELYNSSGALVTTTTTDAAGKYTFNVLNGTYTIRVVNSTVSSSRTGSTAALIPVQTYNGTTTRVGGENPSYTDAAANSGSQTLAALSSGTILPESIATIISSGAATVGPDFGFNFDLVVNTNNAGQGSLRQFILNANALGNEAALAQSGSYINAGTTTALPASKETSIFMIPSGQAVAGLLASTNNGPASQLTNGVAVISPTAVLTNITGPNTNLDATTQTANIGDNNTAVLGTGGTVGTNNTVLNKVNGPEVQLVGTRGFDGLVVAGASTTIRGLSLYRFDHNITVNADITNFLVEQNVLGTSATSFTDPGVGARTVNEGILLNDADNGTVRNNLIGYNGGMGVWVQGFNNGSNNNTIAGNEIRGNAQESKPAPEGLVFDGLELQGASTGNTVSGNLITGTNGHGIDSYFNAIGGNTITGNTISNNGVAVTNNTGEEGSGLRIFGATNLTVISNNILSGNNGSGILVAGSANTVRISQNSIFGNTRLGIDLLSTAENNAPTFYNGNTGATTNVTINDDGDGDTGGNGLLNFPVITSATVQGNTLVVQGYARPGALIEFFAAAGTANSVAANAGFGQGQTYLGSFTEGSADDLNGGTGSYSGTINGLTQGADNTNRFAFSIPLTGNFASITTGSVLTSTATLGNSTSEFSGNVTAQNVALTGYVFEDVNYGGGAGRSRATAGTATRPNARVELYDNTGTFVAATTTDATGQYSFNAAAGTYTVRVVNNTVTSSRAGYVAGLLPVQTYNGTSSRVGGEAPAKVDAANGATGTILADLNTATTIAESQATITIGLASNTTGPDFGFNFDVVTNTNDSGQGSLRQFITNANALTNANLAQVGQTAGKEVSIFMIPNGATTNVPAGLRAGLPSGLTNGVALITVATTLPALTDANTTLDGSTQTSNIGDTNTGTLGTAGTVGVGPDGIANTGDELALTAVNKPEVQIQSTTSTTVNIGLDVQAAGTTLRGLSVLGFGTATNDDNNANVRVGNITGFLIENDFLGIAATTSSLAYSTTSSGTGDNLRIISGKGNGTTTGATASIIQNNLIGYAQGKGIGVENGSTGVVIRNNEIRNNSIGADNLDGIDIENSSATIITGNYILDNFGAGVDMYGSAGSNTITGNTITNNGRANGENAGVRLFGSSNRVSQNIITNNIGAGIAVTNGTNTTSTATNTNNNVLSMNSISGNGSVASNGNVTTGNIGIDLETTNNTLPGGSSPFVSYNDNGDTDTGANGLLNYPVITAATIRNGNLLLTGFAKTGALLEFFVATSNAPALNAIGANFGQGAAYLFSRTEGSATDLDATTGSYGQSNATINGFYQGTETGQNRFSFSIPLSSLTSAQQAALATSGVKLTATATITSASATERGTSEFSGNVPVQQAPVANNDFATTTPGTAYTFAGTTAVTANDTPSGTIDPTTVTLGTAVPTSQGVFTVDASGNVTFTPAAGFVGIATIPYTVKNTSGTVSNTAYISVEVKGTTFNLATTISGPSSANAGASVTYNVTPSNPGLLAATGVVETVQLPAGLTTTGFTVGGSTGTLSNSIITFPTGSYNQNTGLLTLTIGNLAASTSASATAVVFPAPASDPLIVTANISGNGGTETTTTDNMAAVPTTITPRFDVTTAINGPSNVTAGNEVTYTIVTSNVATSVNVNSVSPATNVVQTVTLPGNVTGIYASNGGTVAFNSGANTTTVTFPAISTLAAGQSQVNTISFVAPSNDFLAPVAVVTSGLTNTNAGDINSPTVGTNNNTAQLNGAAVRPTVTSKAGTGTATNVYTTITPSATNVAAGADITLTITASNAGPGAAAGVQETVALPAGLTFSNLGGGSYNSATGLLTFPALTSNLAIGSSQTYTVTFAAPQQGFVLATATVSTSNADLVPNDNVAEAKVEVTPVTDVATTLAGPVVALPGQTVSYTVTTANNGVATANGVVQKVQLPAGLTNVQLNGVAANSTQYDATSGVLTISFADPLAMGFTQTNTISFTAPASMSSFSPVASVSTSTNETTIANNTATVLTTITPSADVTVSATAAASAVVGNQVLYVVGTTNKGATTATSVAPTLQLPAGLGAANVTFPGGANTGTYDNTTGLVTFPIVGALANGASLSNEVAVTMPDVAQLTGVAQVTTTSYDTNLDNNYASVATTPVTATTTTADLQVATFTPATTAVNASTATTLTATFSNLGTGTATNVVPQIVLVPGLTGVTASNNGNYDPNTGIVTYPTVATIAGGAAVTGTYTVTFTAPASGSIKAVAAITSGTSDGALSNNTALATVNVTSQANATTSISGPTTAASGSNVTTATPGSRVTYAVATSNVSTASPATGVVQTVMVPSTVTGLTYPAGSSVSTASGITTITFPTIASLAGGSANAVTNYLSFITPSTPTTVTVAGAVTSDVDTNTGNNSASVVTISNRAPVVYNVVNSLQSPEGNTATKAMLISPLVGTDADNNTLTYKITSLPTSGTLYLADGTTVVTTSTNLTAAQVSQLRYLPAIGFVGNAFFSYVATDNATVAATSNTALYTIQVGTDQNSTYAVTPTKGGVSPYQNNDVLTYITDLNGARYVTSGSSTLVYNATTGVLLAGASNGLPTTGTNATVTSGSSLTAAQLALIGVSLDATTGQLYVSDRTKLKSGSYSVTVTTTDVNGGTNTIIENFTIGSAPLPVELTAFTATAKVTDAVLAWTTASEKNNDHFVVERSFDGQQFTAVGTVAGNGSTSSVHNYSFVDKAAARFGQKLYYRLRQVDTDSTEFISPVRTVQFSAVTTVAMELYPNPAVDQTTLDLTQVPAGTYSVTLVDAAGRVLSTQQLAGGITHTLQVQNLPAGTYIVVIDGNSVHLNKRLLKQ